MAFTLSTASPNNLLCDGGHEITITGLFEEGHYYKVYLGDLGTIDDPPCYSGIPGQGYLISPKKSIAGGIFDTLTVYNPKMLPSVTPYKITVIDYGTLEVHVLSNVITVHKKQFFTTVYNVKRLQPPHYYVGARTIELENGT